MNMQNNSLHVRFSKPKLKSARGLKLIEPRESQTTYPDKKKGSKQNSCLKKGGFKKPHSRPQSSSAHDQQGGRALGNPGTYTAPDWFTAETIKTKETFD